MLLIQGIEWLIIILLFFMLIVGGKGVSEISRKIGRAVGEYQRTKKSLEQEFNRFNKIDLTPVSNEREKLERIARAFNIDPNGKSDDELRELIQKRIQDL